VKRSHNGEKKVWVLHLDDNPKAHELGLQNAKYSQLSLL
jgi:hypothetical protein